MNTLEIKRLKIPSDYETAVFVIDGRPLYEYLKEWAYGDEQLLYKPDMLAICWTDNYDFDADARFMRYCLEQQHANVPILSCPDDFDFSCTVIVAEVEKTEDRVLWKRIGCIDHSAWNLEDERKSGVLFIEKYTDDDWNKYGNTFVFENTESKVFKDYESEHWDDELYKRRINHTFPYYQKEENVRWFSKSYFEFPREEYEKVIDSCYS